MQALLMDFMKCYRRIDIPWVNIRYEQWRLRNFICNTVGMSVLENFLHEIEGKKSWHVRCCFCILKYLLYGTFSSSHYFKTIKKKGTKESSWVFLFYHSTILKNLYCVFLSYILHVYDLVAFVVTFFLNNLISLYFKYQSMLMN